MPLAVKINVALREQNFQKVGSERVKQMQANQEKFQGIAIGKKSYETITSFKLKDTPIVFEDEVTVSS